MNAVGISFTTGVQLKVSCKMQDPQNLHAVLRTRIHRAIGSSRYRKFIAAGIERAREKSKGWNAITKSHQPSAQSLSMEIFVPGGSYPWFEWRKQIISPCTAVYIMWARINIHICACTRALALRGDLFIRGWRNVCIMHTCICISRLIMRDGKRNVYLRIRHLRLFVGKQQRRLAFAHGTVRSHLFYELRSISTQRSIVRNSQL